MIAPSDRLRICNDRTSAGKMFTYVEVSTETLSSILARVAIPRATDGSGSHQFMRCR